MDKVVRFQNQDERTAPHTGTDILASVTKRKRSYRIHLIPFLLYLSSVVRSSFLEGVALYFFPLTVNGLVK